MGMKTSLQRATGRIKHDRSKTHTQAAKGGRSGQNSDIPDPKERMAHIRALVEKMKLRPL